MTTDNLFVRLSPFLLLAAAACNDSNGFPPPNTYVLRTAAPSGKVADYFLVQEAGRTLYIFERDLPAGGGKAAVSDCTTAACIAAWPPFHVSDGPLSGIAPTDLGEVVRADGIKQSSYRGFPLYTFAGDVAAGDTNGEGSTGGGPTPTWFAARLQAFAVMSLTDPTSGRVTLTDGGGHTLYMLVRDTAGSAPHSVCTDACLDHWPVFSASSSVLPSSIDAARLSSFTRDDGIEQSTLDGHPLYYFIDDAAPGDDLGLDFAPAMGTFTTIDPASAR